uniref:DNA modification methylase n=1 Tax=Aerococcus urinaeequi TaxID=51665 RepID=UPI00352BB27E
MEDNLKYLSVDDLIPYVNNPRDNDGAVDYVAKSIKEFGFKVPIVVDKNYIVVAGHTRLKASKKLGLEKVPVIIADDLSDEKIKAFRVADNKVAEIAVWKEEELHQELTELEGMLFDMTEFGFDSIGELIEEEVEEDDFDIEEPIEPKAKNGDVYKLGEHRLMCGDSVDEKDVNKLMGETKADMIFTDPPYLMNFTGNVHGDGSKSFNSKHGTIENDNMSREDGDEFIGGVFSIIKKFVIGSWYVCFYRLGLDYIYRAVDENDMQQRALIIWDKGNHTLSNSDYMSKYEPIVYGWNEEHNFYGGRSNFDIWNVARTKKNDLHPTMKPLELCSKAIQNSSKKGDTVLDLFGGSGSTLIASEQLGRKCYMMELDPKYVDVIINRWEELTGLEAELLEE